MGRSVQSNQSQLYFIDVRESRPRPTTTINLFPPEPWPVIFSLSFFVRSRNYFRLFDIFFLSFIVDSPIILVLLSLSVPTPIFFLLGKPTFFFFLVLLPRASPPSVLSPEKKKKRKKEKKKKVQTPHPSYQSACGLVFREKGMVKKRGKNHQSNKKKKEGKSVVSLFPRIRRRLYSGSFSSVMRR